MMETRNESRAGFYLCLARAFLTPESEVSYRAARDHLAADLAELANACGYDVGTMLDEHARAMAAIPDLRTLQVIHARLFLTPGDPHPSLNTGAYLDGTLAGGSVTAMLSCYRNCGLDPLEGFHDLPDHPAMQLEFVAWLFAAQDEPDARLPLRAEEFLEHFVIRWAGAFRADVEAAGKRFGLAANPYVSLACLVEIAALADAAAEAPDPAATVDPEILRLRKAHAGREPDAGDLAAIQARLAASGHATVHLDIPLAQRDDTMGLHALSPPAPPRAR